MANKLWFCLFCLIVWLSKAWVGVTSTEGSTTEKVYIRGGQPLARVPNSARERFYPARERCLGNEIFPPSNEKVNNLFKSQYYLMKLDVRFFIFVC